MPTSGKLKSGDSLFCIISPPKNTTNPWPHPPPPPQFDPVPHLSHASDLGHEVLHEVQTMTICFYDCNGKIISVSDEIPFTVMKYHLPNTLYLRANSKSKPPGAYIWRGDLMERFFHFKVGGWGMHKIWRGLFSEFCSMCKNAPETQL